MDMRDFEPPSKEDLAQAAKGEKRIEELKAAGHPPHCAARQVWGDGECECGNGKKYHDREWLTEKGDSATPAIVSFAGEAKWGSRNEQFRMIEVSSCHDKVRLHMTPDQDIDDWINQVRKLHAHIGRYLDFLNARRKR